MNQNKSTTALSRASRFIIDRLSERSTRLAISAVAGLLGVYVNPEMFEHIVVSLGVVAGLVEAVIPDDMRKQIIISREANELQQELKRKADEYIPPLSGSEQVRSAQITLQNQVSKALTDLRANRASFLDVNDVRSVGAVLWGRINKAEADLDHEVKNDNGNADSAEPQ